MLIKFFLIGSVVVVALYLMRSGHSGHHLVIRRLGVFAFALTWAAAVAAPGLVQSVADLMGVVRGTDLVLYVLVVAFVFFVVAQQRRMHDLDDRIATLTRQLALRGVTSDPQRARQVADDEHVR